ncbi:hypothetical protein TNCV_4584191 [Trichonephila clavipes]|nr:hypothetical protein TNCV_4584191 [Trichonephila clavipes]
MVTFLQSARRVPKIADFPFKIRHIPEIDGKGHAYRSSSTEITIVHVKVLPVSSIMEVRERGRSGESDALRYSFSSPLEKLLLRSVSEALDDRDIEWPSLLESHYQTCQFRF